MPPNKKKIRIKSPKNKNTIFGLPAKSYTDRDFWEKECDTVLSNGWLFIGFVHEFNKAGDVQPIFIAG
jgi:choline monooxygenase